MRNKILLTIMSIFFAVMIFGCGTNSETEKDITSSNKEEGTTGTDSELETETESTTEEITEDTEDVTTEEVTTEVQNNYTYAFEGKYWVNYSEYGNVGYYFDGTKVTWAMENHGKEDYPYSVVESWIDIEGESYVYEMSNGQLGLCYAMGDGSDMSYYEEVDKAEFERLFN